MVILSVRSCCDLKFSYNNEKLTETETQYARILFVIIIMMCEFYKNYSRCRVIEVETFLEPSIIIAMYNYLIVNSTRTSTRIM